MPLIRKHRLEIDEEDVKPCDIEVELRCVMNHAEQVISRALSPVSAGV